MKIYTAAILLCVASLAAADEPKDAPQTAHFVDGYHGGVYGHYPPGYTAFLVEQLKAHPDWKINLEIEPETWDVARVSEPEAYRELQELMRDQSDGGRIEFVNPTYAQSYLFQSSGESLIRQFDYGIRKLKSHFLDVVLTTYSSEEPCFTSCLPPVLRSFGYEFAVLKNPNTCWGGYASAYGGELVNWIGPDGTSMLTVPRYQCEALQPDSSWQTIAWGNSQEYLQGCAQQGINHPVGMCLQDAGWRGGPWLGSGRKDHATSHYVTWRDYIRNITSARTDDNWRVSQEDIKPGLMWGAQVLQRIAQQSRCAENHLLVAEKIAAMAWVDVGHPPMNDAIDEAWHNVLLSQHHDCWIVPYNGRIGNNWADQVRRWTNVSNSVSDLQTQRSLEVLLREEVRRSGRFVRLFNPNAVSVDAVVPVAIPKPQKSNPMTTVTGNGRRHATQIVESDVPWQSQLLVRAELPPLGYATVELRDDGETVTSPVTALEADDGIVLESDLYHLEFDPAAGGTIRSLVAKTMGDFEFVDDQHERRFNELRGNFYEQDGFHSSTDNPANIRVVEQGPLRASVEITGTIAGNDFVQRVSVTQGSPVIDCSVQINWHGKPRIGEYEETDGFKNRRRPAYDDRFKLLALFPNTLGETRIVKNAAFDVCESKLDNTFYNSWEDIKHNVILNWVDAEDSNGEYGLALFSDHTTSYTHGKDHPLGLTIQYAGKGLWGRDYTVEGPTQVKYALVPHADRWNEAAVSAHSCQWQQPPVGATCRAGQSGRRSLLDVGDSGWEVPAMFVQDDALFVRLFNASGAATPHSLIIGFNAKMIESVELDGRVTEELTTAVGAAGKTTIRLQIPPLGFRTLRFSDVSTPSGQSK